MPLYLRTALVGAIIGVAVNVYNNPSELQGTLSASIGYILGSAIAGGGAGALVGWIFSGFGRFARPR